jgi:hypothetical protein
MTDWVITSHAQEQMEERGLTRDQVDTVLRRPEISAPDPMGKPDCRYYVGGGMLAVVDEASREVITVGVSGASNRDWESFLPPSSEPLPPEPPKVRPRRNRGWRVKEQTLPVTRTNVLDGVHPGIARGVRAYLAANGLDFRSVRVLGPTQVEINPH